MKKLLNRNQAKKVWNNLLPIDKHPYNTFENFFKSNDWKATKKRKQKPKKVNFISTNLQMNRNQAKKVWNNLLPIDKHPYNTFENFFKSNDWKATKKRKQKPKKTKILKANDKLNEEEQARRQDEFRRNKQYWKDQEQIRKQDELRREEEEQIRREQRREEDLRREEEEQIRREQRREEELRRKEEEQVSEQISSPSVSSSSTNTGGGDTFEKFEKGTLDLPTAFWGFFTFGSIIVGVICGALSEMVSKFFNIPYVLIMLFILSSTWKCAENYKKIMDKKNQSVVWGVLTQIFCVVSYLGLAVFIYDSFQ